VHPRASCDLFYFVYFVYGAYYRVENAERGVSTVTVLREREPVKAADKDAPVVRELDVALAKTRGVATLIAPSGEEIELPHSVYRVLARVVHEMAQGNAVRVLPVHAQLSTQEAAELLSVSRPFLIRLLEEGKIPYHKVGRHRRIVLEDLLVYKQERDEERRRTLNELARESQELGFYDE
jgi:excisionase family DNA binding protein